MMDTELTVSQMEAILGPDSVQFETLISDLWSSAEEKLSEAKSVFNMMKQKAPDLLVLKLADLLGLLPVIDSRERCAFLLHTLLTDDKCCIWGNLNVLTQSSVKSILLKCTKLEKSNSLIKKLCHTVATLANLLLPHNYNNWPELLPFLNELCVSSNSNRQSIQSFFLIFAQLAEGMCETLVPEMMILHSVFLNTLKDDTLDPHVRRAVLTTAFRFIRYQPSLKERQRFQNILAATMRLLTYALSNSEDALAQDVLVFLTRLAENEPWFLRTQLADVVNTIFEIAEAKSLKEPTRHMAVDFVVEFLEGREKALGMLKKLPRFTNTYFAILLNLLRDIKDEPHWHSAETNNEDADAGAMNGYYFGCDCLRQLSKALGAKTISHIAIEQLSANLVAPEWETRHAALIALACIAEGSSKVMNKYLEQLVNMVLHSFQDPHPRVRWAAVNAIMKLCSNFSPGFQEQCCNQTLHALAAVMDDIQNPRVQALAAEAVKKFFIIEKPETLVPFLDGIVNKLLVLLQNNNQIVQEAALEALSCIFDLSEDSRRFYDVVMPYLRTLLVNANDKSNHMLRSKVLEYISFVGMAIGKEKFGDDLKQTMEVLKLLQESQLKEVDTIVYILEAWTRICLYMGKDFLPYMSTVMPFLVECAQLEPNKTVSTDGSYPRMQKVKFGDEIICIKQNDYLYLKSVACSSLGSYARSLKEDFYPWISQAASVLVPLLKFYMYNDIRRTAARALYFLLHSATLAVEKGTAQGGNKSCFKQLSVDIILAFGDALYSEPETKLCAHIMCYLDDCLWLCGQLLNEDQVRSIFDEIKHVITESSRRKGELTERAKSKDFDAEAADLLREEREQEEEVFRNAGQILVTLIRTFKAAFFPFLDELSSYLMPIEGEDKTAAERRICFLIFDKLVEYCGEAALKYYNMYLPFLLEASNDENPLVRQALPRINVVIMHCRAREPENELAYDNAVSALGKICQLHQESVDLAQIIPAWLNCLPIRGDMSEFEVVHDQLCSMVERSDRELLGPKYEHFPKIMSVFAEVLCAGNNLATGETRNRIINLLKNLQRTVPAATWALASSLLLPQQEMELESVLSPEGGANFP